MTVIALAEGSNLGDVPLTPAQRATLRRHVERVQTTLHPQSKHRVDVRHLFHKHEHSSDKVSSKSEDESQKQHKDDIAHCVTDVNILHLSQLVVCQRCSFVIYRCLQ